MTEEEKTRLEDQLSEYLISALKSLIEGKGTENSVRLRAIELLIQLGWGR